MGELRVERVGGRSQRGDGTVRLLHLGGVRAPGTCGWLAGFSRVEGRTASVSAALLCPAQVVRPQPGAVQQHAAGGVPGTDAALGVQVYGLLAQRVDGNVGGTTVPSGAKGGREGGAGPAGEGLAGQLRAGEEARRLGEAGGARGRVGTGQLHGAVIEEFGPLRLVEPYAGTGDGIGHGGPPGCRVRMPDSAQLPRLFQQLVRIRGLGVRLAGPGPAHRRCAGRSKPHRAETERKVRGRRRCGEPGADGRSVQRGAGMLVESVRYVLRLRGCVLQQGCGVPVLSRGPGDGKGAVTEFAEPAHQQRHGGHPRLVTGGVLLRLPACLVLLGEDLQSAWLVAGAGAELHMPCEGAALGRRLPHQQIAGEMSAAGLDGAAEAEQRNL